MQPCTCMINAWIHAAPLSTAASDLVIYQVPYIEMLGVRMSAAAGVATAYQADPAMVSERRRIMLFKLGLTHCAKLVCEVSTVKHKVPRNSALAHNCIRINFPHVTFRGAVSSRRTSYRRIPTPTSFNSKFYLIELFTHTRRVKVQIFLFSQAANP